ncbi:MAG: hypothetical protein IPP42_01640 [Saprospiraceae bacterium]|nr:hypothetical protein [Saprospiraceae bacterium]
MDGYCPMDSVTISANNGFASYLWSNGDAAQSTTIKTNGTYTVTVTDANGCKTQSSKIITQYTPPDAFISGTLSFVMVVVLLHSMPVWDTNPMLGVRVQQDIL